MSGLRLAFKWEVLLSTPGSRKGKPFSQGSHLGSSIQAELDTKSRDATYPHPGVRGTQLQKELHFGSTARGLCSLGDSLLAFLTLFFFTAIVTSSSDGQERQEDAEKTQKLPRKNNHVDFMGGKPKEPVLWVC